METHTLLQYLVIAVFGLICCFAFLSHGRTKTRNNTKKHQKKRVHKAMDSTPAVPTRAAAAQPSSSTDSEPHAGGACALLQLKATFNAIRKIYPKYGPRLAAWWAQQGQAERLEFLQVRGLSAAAVLRLLLLTQQPEQPRVAAHF
jgi:hypothetical protein